MKILGWSNEAGGVHHYRIREPLRGLKLLGHETEITKSLMGQQAIDTDVLLVRGLHNARNSVLWRGLAAMPNHPLLVFDMDDDVWAWQPGSPEDHYWTDDKRYNLELNIQCADLVTTPTISLYNILRILNPNAAILPNCIPRMLLKLVPSTRERFVIGWQGASQHVRDLQLIYNPIFRFMLRHSDVELHLWGPGNFADLPRGLAERVKCFPWIESTWQHYYRLNMDVGLAPLDHFDLFNYTKSDIRLREYSALGIPFIASNVPAYRETAIEAGGYLASDENDWEECLENLYCYSSLRADLSSKGRAIATRWTTESNAHRWESAYVSAINGEPASTTSKPATSATSSATSAET